MYRVVFSREDLNLIEEVFGELPSTYIDVLYQCLDYAKSLQQKEIYEY